MSQKSLEQTLDRANSDVVLVVDADRQSQSVAPLVAGFATNPNPARVINLSLGGGGACGTTRSGI